MSTQHGAKPLHTNLAGLIGNGRKPTRIKQQRYCQGCNTQLSRYNKRDLCGVCQRKEATGSGLGINDLLSE